MTTVDIEALGSLAAHDVRRLRNAMTALNSSRAIGQTPTPAVVQELSEAIDTMTAGMTALATHDLDLYGQLADEVNAAVHRYNQVVEAINATGAWCQFCGDTIVVGAEAVPTAEIPEENIQLYAHADCAKRVQSDEAAGEGSS